MKVKDLRFHLKDVNPEAEVRVIAHNRAYQFSVSFGGGDGCTQANCDSMSFYVDALCQNERAEASNG